MHAGRVRGGAPAIEQIVRAANGLHPDIIVLLGDMVHSGRQASKYLSLLEELEARQGIWACLGNHEHGFVWYSRYLGPSPVASVDEWRRIYADLGIELLVNEARPVEKSGARIWLVGVDDAYSGNDDLPKALQGVDRNEFCLAITHSPDLVDNPRVDELDLVFAGHTHGGQVCLPLLGPIYAPCRKPRQRASGLICTNRTTMYVSRGVGEAMPIRFRCPRELTLITLRTEGGQ